MPTQCRNLNDRHVAQDPKRACGKKQNSFEAVMRLQYLCESGMPLVASTLFQKFNFGVCIHDIYVCFSLLSVEANSALADMKLLHLHLSNECTDSE